MGFPYHTPDDTIDYIDFPFLLNVIKAFTATLCVLAGTMGRLLERVAA